MADEITLSKGERTRQAIIEAAHELFVGQGYSATSMRQIATRAGVALGGIYNHFGSKDEIFQALVIAKHPYAQIFPVLEKVPGANVEEFVRNAAQIIQDELGHRPDFMKLVFIEIVEFGGSHFPKLMETIYPSAVPMLARFAGSPGGLRPISMPLLQRVFLGSIIAYYMTSILMSHASLPAEMRNTSLADFMDIYLHGILENQKS